MQVDAVYGPYKHRHSWRVELHGTKGGRRKKTRKTFDTEREALRFMRKWEREIAKARDAETLRAKAEELRKLADQYAARADECDGRGLTVGEAMEEYAGYMLNDKGNKAGSVETTLHRLRGLFGELDVSEVSLTRITERRAEQFYEARRQVRSVDTHRGELGQMKTFMNWCVGKGWIRRNPFADVQPMGRRKRGKKQLRIDETRLVDRVALAQARTLDSALRGRWARHHRLSSLAVLVALYLALRASEVVNIRRRDVDAGGRLLWIDDAKSESGRRTLEVAKVLRPLLWKRAQECGDAPEARLFPRCREWVLYNVKRLCRLAKVPEVTAHGARGIHSTVATQMGATSHLLALAMGHSSPEVTRRHYIRPGAAEDVTRDLVERWIEDGREKNSEDGRTESNGRDD